MELRPYQKRSVEAVLSAWYGVDKTLLVLPTGTGKTVVFSKIAEERAKQGKVLILAHRGELLEQAKDKLYKFTGLDADIEKAESYANGSDVVVGSVQTLINDKRLDTFGNEYKTIIIDEAHHALSDSYQKVLNHFPQAKVLGVTATPDRGDMKNLGRYFDSLAYEYTLPEAIKEGYLCKIKALTIPLNIDLSSLKVSAGDFTAASAGSAIEPYLEQIADEMVKVCMDKKTVVFLPLIETSQKFCELLNERGFRACEVNGNSSDRAEKLRAFEDGEYNVLCNSMLLTEGWDCPSVDCVVVLRPTKVRSLYTQMVGRGTRLSPGKDHLLILDFLWHTERHRLCKPAVLISRNEDIEERMNKLAEGKEIDLHELEKLAVKDAREERERALREELEKQRHKKKKLVDPLQYEMSISGLDLSGYVPSFKWEEKKPTDKQLAGLERLGINPDGIDSAGKASLLLDRLINRAKAGMSTPKQIRLLERYGFKRVGDWTREEATKMISRISARRWMVPRDIDPAVYLPDRLRGAYE